MMRTHQFPAAKAWTVSEAHTATHTTATPEWPAASAEFFYGLSDARQRSDRLHARILCSRLRRVGVVALRVIEDGALVSAVALAVRDGGFWAGGPMSASPALPVVTVLVVALLALGAAGAYRTGVTQPHAVATPLVACVLLAVSLGALASRGGTAWHGWPLAGVVLGVGGALFVVGHLRLRRAARRGEQRTALTAAVLIGRDRDISAALAALNEADGRAVIDRLPSGPGRRIRPDPLLRQLRRRLARGDVNEVVVVSVLRVLTLRALASACWAAGVRCVVAFDAREVRIEPGLRTQLGDHAATELIPARWRVPGLPLKRAIDIVLSVLLMPLALPLVGLTALAIRLDSRGPIFYCQRRVGLGGREFVIWKFRSMHTVADEPSDLARLNHYGDAPLFKLENDPRITRVGRLLRRTSLDELPQLLNVLRGEMSLVGPRPPLPQEVARYDAHHYVRLSVIPGMTGPWQVGGRNLITDFEQIVRMEREYIDGWSLGLDLRIMLRTVGVVVTGTGAY